MYTKLKHRDIKISTIALSELTAEDYFEIRNAKDFDILIDADAREADILMEVFDRQDNNKRR